MNEFINKFFIVLLLLTMPVIYLLGLFFTQAYQSQAKAKRVAILIAFLTVLPLFFWFLPSFINFSGELVNMFSEARGNPIIYIAALAHIVPAALLLTDYKKFTNLAMIIYLVGFALTWWISFNIYDPDAGIPTPYSFYATMVGILPCFAIIGFIFLADSQKKKK